MTDFLLSIDWDVNPIVFSIFGHPIVWYGILWATGVALTEFFVYRMLRNDGYTDDWIYSFSVNVILGLVIGARLGHCLFYDPIGYLSRPLDLLKIWEGGLASHGGAIGMLIAVCIFAMKMTKKKINWYVLSTLSFVSVAISVICYFGVTGILDFNNITLSYMFMGLFIGLCIALIYNSYPTSIKLLDRLIVGVTIGAMCIRLGNLMNSEIFGGHTTLPWGFNFYRSAEWITTGAMPSHPTQLYEASIYLLIFILSMYLYWKTSAKEKTGLLLGICLIGIFGSRFLIEFIKNIQANFEEEMILHLGQLLSIPFIVWGVLLIWNANFRSSKKSLDRKL